MRKGIREVGLVWGLFVLMLEITGTEGAPRVEGRFAALENGLVRVRFDLQKGTYDLREVPSGTVAIRGAYAEWGDLSTREERFVRRATVGHFKDVLGSGRRLTVECACPKHPTLLLEFRLYPKQPFVVLRMGVRNGTDRFLHVHQFKPLTGGEVFPRGGIKTDFRTLDDPSGANQTQVRREPYRFSPNNLLVTFRQAGRRRSVVLGGLQTSEFVKFAGLLPEGGNVGLRRHSLDQAWPGARLAAYLDCGGQSAFGSPEGPQLRVVQGQPFQWHPPVGETLFQTIVFDDQEVILQAQGLDPAKRYVLGFSWWDFDDNGRVESVQAMASDGLRRTLLEKQSLPAYLHKNELPVERALPLPPEVYRDGACRLAFTKEGGISNAVVSEVWLWEEESSGEVPSDWKGDRTVGPLRGRLPARAELQASDPVGKRIRPGQLYWPNDSFYLDFWTANPFEALERYGWQLRQATGARPRPYDFPTVCAWYAGVANTPGAQNHPEKSKYRLNTTPGLVEEMEEVRKSGFLRYSRVAGRLVPDNYAENNPQGWWDDAHWQREGFYKAPYETSRKWGQAMRERGGLAFTYFQSAAALPSRDFRETFPHLLLGPNRTLDYTKPEVRAYMRRVYAALRGGIFGMMFDYCDELWANEASRGSFQDSAITATAFYRTFLRLAKEGLGPASWIHERALHQPPADLALGIVDSRRTSGDTTQIEPAMVARSGLRWYKNRVVLAYDMDSKDLLNGWKTGSYAGTDTDGRRMLLTMAYVAAGRLLLANSFRDLPPEALYDLSRTFPYHSTPQSARPIDAFVSEGWPRVYDFVISPQWHQLTLYNHTEPSREELFAVRLSGDTADGALGLDPRKEYYVYDFWNDRFVGRLKGRDRLSERLRPGEARMLSIHEAEPHPQFLSTNRHLMQGYVDLARLPQWDEQKRELSGASRVVGGETYRIVLALNGWRPRAQNPGKETEGVRVTLRQEQPVPPPYGGGGEAGRLPPHPLLTKGGRGRVSSHLEMLPGGQLAVLCINSPRNATVDWTVSFLPAREGDSPLTTATFEGRYIRGQGDVEYLQLLDAAYRLFYPDPEAPNISMLYTPRWNGFVEGPTWGAWWIQNSYGPSYCALPFFQEPYTTFLQNSQDLWFDQMGDGQRVGGGDWEWVAPDGCLCDAASPGWIYYKQGDGRVDIHDWGLEFTAAGIVLQAELLLISRNRPAIRHYLPMLERSANFIETRRDPRNNLFLAGPAGNLLAPSYAGWKKPDGTYAPAYLTGLSITYIAALDRLIELEKMMGRREQVALYTERRDRARQGLATFATEEGYFIKYLDPDGTRHGVYGAEKHGYFEAVCNHDAIAFRVVDDAQAGRIYDRIAALPGLRPYDVILTNYPGLDDLYIEPQGLWSFGDWVNGGHWTTCEARMILAYYRLGKYDDALRSMKHLLEFFRAFRPDNPLTNFGSQVYQPQEPINCVYDTWGAPAAMLRGLFEYLYRADGLTLIPHLPPGISRLEQRFPVRFGTKRLYLSTEGTGPLTAVWINGKPWKSFDSTSVFLPYEQIPVEAHVTLCLGGAAPRSHCRPPSEPAPAVPTPEDRFWDLRELAASMGGNGRPLRIGADSNGANLFRGDIQRARLFRRALRAEEIRTLAEDPSATLPGDPALVADYLLGQVKDGLLANAAGEGLPAQVVGTLQLVDTPPGKALRFSGQGYLEVATDPRLDLREAYTLDAWICPHQLPALGSRIIDRITAGADDGYLLDTCPGNSLRFITEGGTIGFDAQLPPNTWAHVAATFDAADGLRLYLNGRLVASGPAQPSQATTALGKIGALYARLVQAGLGESYEAQHAKLVVDSVMALRGRMALKAARKLPPLPPASQFAADKSYFDAANRLAEGLVNVLNSYATARNSRQRRVFALWQEVNQDQQP